MARGRFISKALYTSSRKFRELAKKSERLGEFAQSLFPALVINTDDFGRLAGDSFSVKYNIFPLSDRREEEFETVLRLMHDENLIVRYLVDGLQVIEIVNFDKEQTGLHKRTRSKLPGPEEGSLHGRELPGTSGNFAVEAEVEDKVKDKEKNKNMAAPFGAERESTKQISYSQPFLDFWQAYPKKTKKDAAVRVWNRLKLKTELDAILSALAKQKASHAWTKDGGQYVPNPATYLNEGRWKDETVEPARSPPTQNGRADPMETLRKMKERYSGGEDHDREANFGDVDDSGAIDAEFRTVPRPIE